MAKKLDYDETDITEGRKSLFADSENYRAKVETRQRTDAGVGQLSDSRNGSFEAFRTMLRQQKDPQNDYVDKNKDVIDFHILRRTQKNDFKMYF